MTRSFPFRGQDLHRHSIVIDERAEFKVLHISVSVIFYILLDAANPIDEISIIRYRINIGIHLLDLIVNRL